MYQKNSIIPLIKSSVLSTEPQATVVLYGSYARGDNQDDSDVDILILLDTDKVTWADEKRISFPLYDIEINTGTIISPLVLSKKEWATKHRITSFYKNIIKEGKVL